MEIFEQGSRLKLRFDTPKGMLTVEDLWDLPLSSTVGRPNLDDVARGLHRQLKDTAEESFVSRPVQTDAAVQLAFEIVKRVIEVRLTETEAARSKAENKAKKQRLLELIAHKQDEALGAKSVEELQGMVEAL